MAYKSREKQREAEHRWYLKNKDKVLAKKRRKKDRLRQLVREAKSVPCVDCGQEFPYYVMDFDHVDGTKVMMVSQLAIRGATRKLTQEMAKCEVVCSNCHRIRTWARLQFMPPAGQELAANSPFDEQLCLALDAR